MQFCSITKEEFEQFLGIGVPSEQRTDLNRKWKFHKLSLANTSEAVYGMVVARNITLRVYSTLQEGQTREKGEDAIRCVLAIRDPKTESLPINQQIIKVAGVKKKVLRVKGWRKNLGERISSWEEMIGPNCPVCNTPMIKRQNRQHKTAFFGCTNYPNCRCTKQIDGITKVDHQ